MTSKEKAQQILRRYMPKVITKNSKLLAKKEAVEYIDSLIQNEGQDSLWVIVKKELLKL